MPEKLDEWYNWAMRLDRQYRQEQAESKLMYGSSKSRKSSGGKSEKGKAPQAQALRAQPPAMAVTPIVTESAAPAEAMEVDQVGRQAPLKCFNCGQLGHISKYCKQKRKIRGATIEEVKQEEGKQKNFVEESQ